MSWDADLWDIPTADADPDTDPLEHILKSWNYTHNCNAMIVAALDTAGILIPNREDGRAGAWYDMLHGQTGPDGARLLHTIITGLEADPAQFEAMNPPNGWGSYTTLLNTLRDMRSSVPEQPCWWSTCG